MASDLTNTAPLSYTPLLTEREVLPSERVRDNLWRELVDMPACQMGSIDAGRATLWKKEDCTIEKIEVCAYLRLYQANLSVVPDGVEYLRHLSELDLAGNRLTTLPEWIGNISHLRLLNLGRNKIESLPEQITSLECLEEVNLYDNNLKAIPSAIFRIKNLQKLHLDDNKIKVIPADIGLLKNLKFLSIVQNGLVTLPKELADLNWLDTLCCQYDNDLDESSIEITQKLGDIVKG